MAKFLTAELRSCSKHFEHLLSSLPKNLVSSDDVDEDDGKPFSPMVHSGESNIDLQEKFQAKLTTLGNKTKPKKDRAKILMRRKLQKEKKKKSKKLNSSNNSKGENNTETKKEKVTKVFNQEGNILFSKIDVGDSDTANKKNKRGLPTGKNYKMMLDKVEKQKEKLQKLEEKDKDAAKSTKEKLLWKKVLAKSEGVRVKDNEDYLRQALKKKEKLKDKRKSKWKCREKDVRKKIRERQEKRNQNIDQKKETRRNNKIKRAQKRGRVVFKD